MRLCELGRLVVGFEERCLVVFVVSRGEVDRHKMAWEALLRKERRLLKGEAQPRERVVRTE